MWQFGSHVAVTQATRGDALLTWSRGGGSGVVSASQATEGGLSCTFRPPPLQHHVHGDVNAELEFKTRKGQRAYGAKKAGSRNEVDQGKPHTRATSDLSSPRRPSTWDACTAQVFSLFATVGNGGHSAVSSVVTAVRVHELSRFINVGGTSAPLNLSPQRLLWLLWVLGTTRLLLSAPIP